MFQSKSDFHLHVYFLIIYLSFTPYNELELIKKNNTAAAISLSGACLGFAIPMASAIYFTHDLLEMFKWAVITGLAQITVFAALRRYALAIEDGHNAPAIFLASLSVSVGLLNAICIS